MELLQPLCSLLQRLTPQIHGKSDLNLNSIFKPRITSFGFARGCLRIPLLFPIQNVEAVGAATASASSVVAEKPVTLLPAAFTRDLMHNVTGEQTFKRESTPQPNSVKANQQQQQQQEDVLPSASTTAGAVPVRNSSGKQSSSTADGERAVPYKVTYRFQRISLF